MRIDKSMQNPSSKKGNHEQHSHIPRDMSTRLIKEHSNLFQGVGKLKDAKIHLYIDENVRPVAQTARRLPFHMRKSIDKALDELEENGIIEEATGPTPWVNPLVVVPKPHNPKELRLSVDMRQANRAITHDHHPTATIDKSFMTGMAPQCFQK